MIGLTTRRRNIVTGLISLVLLVAGITVGIKWSFGYFDDTYTLTGSFDHAGQGLQRNSDVKIRGVNVGTVRSVHLVDGRAEVIMEINHATKLPTSTMASVRAKTLFGEKFVDLAPGTGELTGPYYATDNTARLPNDHTTGGFELEQVLGDAYPILRDINPAELANILDTLANAGQGLGPTINRTIVNSQKVFDVMAAHNADTAEFLNDFNTVAGELSKRADDLIGAAQALNTALPNITDHATQLNTLLTQTGRLSDDVADLVRNNQAFIDKSFHGGQAVLDTLYDHRGDIIPLVVGLRQYVQTLTEVIRIPVGDGTYMAAVRGLSGSQLCDVFTCPGTNNPGAAPAPPAAGPAPPAPPPPDQTQPGLLPQLPLPLPVPVPTLPPTPTLPPPPTLPTPPSTGVPGILNFMSWIGS